LTLRLTQDRPDQQMGSKYVIYIFENRNCETTPLTSFCDSCNSNARGRPTFDPGILAALPPAKTSWDNKGGPPHWAAVSVGRAACTESQLSLSQSRAHISVRRRALAYNGSTGPMTLMTNEVTQWLEKRRSQ
jgi:hypothetical protein